MNVNPPIRDPGVWHNIPVDQRTGESGWQLVFGYLSETWLPIGRALVAALDAKGIQATLGDAASWRGAEVVLTIPDLQFDWFRLEVVIAHDKRDRGTPTAIRVDAGRHKYRGLFKPIKGSQNWLRPAESAAAKVAELVEVTRRSVATNAANEERRKAHEAEVERLRREELGYLEPPEGFSFHRAGERLWSVRADASGYANSVDLGTFSPEDVVTLVALLKKGRVTEEETT